MCLKKAFFQTAENAMYLIGVKTQMQLCTSCKESIDSCLTKKTFAAAHLYNDEKPMKIHIHDCYEIYYSISGGKQFLIDNRFYNFAPGDLFFINQYESHYLSQIDHVTHERIIVSIHPDYLKQMSTPETDLNYCFSERNTAFGHRLTLSTEEQKRFLYYVHRFTENTGYGQDVLDQAVFLELMTFLNRIFLERCQTDLRFLNAAQKNQKTVVAFHSQIDEILSYINLNLTEELTISGLADHFFLSPSYLCKIFKDSTGTTINKYITARRITKAKSLLSDGCSVTDTCSLCGFHDYSNFLKSFTRAVGISPKKYAQFSSSSF